MASPRKRVCTLTFVDAAPVKMKLLASNHGNKMVEGLNLLRSQNLLCDLTLVAEKEEFSVHRCVVVASSDYFKAMLTSQMKESREETIELKGITAIGLQSMVSFAYTGCLDICMFTLHDVLQAATHLQVTEAVELCCKFMRAAITEENCVDLMNLTELYSLEETLSFSKKYILDHFEAFAESSQYNKLNHLQLGSMLKENSLKVVSEYKLFELVLKWINHRKIEREKYVAELMDFIRLPLLSGEELVDKVSRVELMKSNPACVQLLMQAKDYHIVISKQPLLQTSRTQVRSEKKCLVMCHAESLESYNFQTRRHSFLKDLPVPLYSPCVCVVDNFMYACGVKYDSNENNEIATARCFRYDPRFDSWHELASMNEARKDFTLHVLNNCLYAIAGQDENMVMHSVECYSIVKNDWETGGAYLGKAVFGHAGAVRKDKIFISGGQRCDGCCDSVLSYSPETDSWQDEPSLLALRSNHQMVVLDDVIYVIGGNREDPYGFPVHLSHIEMLLPGANVWTICKANINVREAGTCIMNDDIYIVGGMDGEHSYSDLIQKFDIKKQSIDIIDKFPTRTYGKACCLLVLPGFI